MLSAEVYVCAIFDYVEGENNVGICICSWKKANPESSSPEDCSSMDRNAQAEPVSMLYPFKFVLREMERKEI